MRTYWNLAVVERGPRGSTRRIGPLTVHWQRPLRWRWGLSLERRLWAVWCGPYSVTVVWPL